MFDMSPPTPGIRSLSGLLADAGISLSDLQVTQLALYRDLLFQHNQHTNLTAVRDIDGIERRLVMESLRLVAPIASVLNAESPRGQTLIDVGTGGGLPGLVLAIAFPAVNVYLLDATGKKVAFLNDVVQELQIANVTPLHGRAEELGHQPRYRNAFDIVTARAVASLPALLELGLPMLRTGGRMLLPKGTDIGDELDAGTRAAAILGAEIESSDVLPASSSSIETRLVIVHKTSITPRAYPRRPGLPAKSPLGTEAAPPRNGRRARTGGGAS